MKQIIHKKVTRKLIKQEPQIVELYDSAFPKSERLPLNFLMWRSKHKDIHFWAFYDHTEFIGFCYFLSIENITYILYITTTEGSRGKGYGSDILDIVKSYHATNTVFLNIEEVNAKSENYNQRVKRLKFYERNGFVLNNFQSVELGNIMSFLSFNGKVTTGDYKKVLRVICTPLVTILGKPKIIRRELS